MPESTVGPTDNKHVLTVPENTQADKTPEAERRTSVLRNVAGLMVIAGMLLSVFYPTSYVVESPGPTFDTLGKVEGHEVIAIKGAETFDPPGNLDLTTVIVGGPPSSVTPTGSVLLSWFSPESVTMPAAVVYPQGTTSEDVQQSNNQAMSTSQEWAVAAALGELDIEYQQKLLVQGFVGDSPAAKILEPGDQVLSVAGEKITGIEGLRAKVQEAAGDDLNMRVLRDGEEKTFQVPVQPAAEEGTWQIGVLLDSQFDFPVDIDILLENVGGASAGMMFALGIIDKMTEEDLADGRHIAGTGTIDPDGTVGPIGGIVQKVHGATEAGAEIFLAPQANCEELTDKVPQGIQVFSVETLSDAVEILENSADEKSVQGFPTCG